MEACQKAEMMEAKSKNSQEALSKVEADLVKIKANWVSNKEKMESEMVKTKVELVEAKKEAKGAIRKYKAFDDFVMENAWMVANFYKLEEFFANAKHSARSPFRRASRWGSLSAELQSHTTTQN